MFPSIYHRHRLFIHSFPFDRITIFIIYSLVNPLVSRLCTPCKKDRAKVKKEEERIRCGNESCITEKITPEEKLT